jgi:hypothetical protein
MYPAQEAGANNILIAIDQTRVGVSRLPSSQPRHDHGPWEVSDVSAAGWIISSASESMSRPPLLSLIEQLDRTKHPHGVVSLDQVDTVADRLLVIFHSFM